jgi:hypothetical protein
MTHTMIPRTNYLMEQEFSLMQVQPVVMEAGTADRTKLAEKKKDGPSRAMLKSLLLSVLHV